MARIAPTWFLLLGMACFFVSHAYEGNLPRRTLSDVGHHEATLRLKAFKASLTKRVSISSDSPSPYITFQFSDNAEPQESKETERTLYRVTSFGADPTGNRDSTNALLAAIAHATRGPTQGFLLNGIRDLGGVQIDLEGGKYLISQPLRLPTAGVGNLMIHGGTIRASSDFPSYGHLIDLSTPGESNRGSPSPSYNFEFITFKDLLLDSNFRGGGISVNNSLRINIDNCFITHFTTTGILSKGGHETYISNSFLGQHITAGGDKGERNFSGTAISLEGNDNAVTDVVIFSAAVGIMVTGQANAFSGVHCYNKATFFGGVGIYLKLSGLTQTRIVNSYMDYTSIVAEDPVQLHISSSFFLGDANVILKSNKGVINGVNVVDNMFSGSGNGVEIVKLDQSNSPFKQIEQVFVARNVVKGMNLKATTATMSVHGNGTSWTADFNKILLFPNLIRHVQYSLSATGSTFANHAIRNVSENRVVIETDKAVTANVFVTVDQGTSS